MNFLDPLEYLKWHQMFMFKNLNGALIVYSAGACISTMLN